MRAARTARAAARGGKPASERRAERGLGGSARSCGTALRSAPPRRARLRRQPREGRRAHLVLDVLLPPFGGDVRREVLGELHPAAEPLLAAPAC